MDGATELFRFLEQLLPVLAWPLFQPLFVPAFALLLAHQLCCAGLLTAVALWVYNTNKLKGEGRMLLRRDGGNYGS